MSVAAHAPDAPTGLPPAVRQRIFVYLGGLLVLMSLGAPFGGLIDVPLSFLLKNRLHLAAHQVAGFRLIAAIPLFLGFAFGYLRDVWNPFGMRDRGFLVLFGATCAVCYAAFAFAPLTYGTLLVATLLLTIAFLFVASAQNGLASMLGQQHVMSGQVSAVWNIVGALPGIAALLIGGRLSNLLEGEQAGAALRILFLTGAALMVAVALYGLWRPASVYDNLRHERAPDAHPLRDARRLLRHRPVYPALLIWLLWNFAPGSSTPLQYYLQNTLHAADAAWGQWNAIFSASFIPTFIVFGVLCRTVALKHQLFWGTVVAVPQMVPLLFIHSLTGALVAAVPIGLMGGVATAAYMDLIIRCCPRGLQGTMLMLAGALSSVAVRFGDVLGTNLYDRFGGFTVCVVAITIVYALILPTLLLVPPHLTATCDGERAR